MAEPVGGAGAFASPSAVSPATRRRALALLFAAYTVNYVDRQVITILQEPIKAELHLSDSQLGLVTGLSFALFYAVLGVPIARLADRQSRKRIIVISMMLWSAMTALCSIVTGFVSLLVIRAGVGIGEAGLTPPAHSLISDYYEPRRRASALAIYSSAGTVGLMVGFLAGGWINELFGWRAALLVVGGPGILLALLVQRTMREPPREQLHEPTAPAVSDMQGLSSAMMALARNRAFRAIALACGAHAFVNYGLGNWTPPFFGRLHGMTSGELGTWLALLSVGPGLVGMLSAGYLADWLGRSRPHARLEVAMASVVLIIPFEIVGLLAQNRKGALICFAGSFFLGGAYLGPAIAAVHAAVSPHLRATSSALVMLGVNFIGLGLGPLAVGIASDVWERAGAGPESLRYAMLAIIPAELAAFGLFARARMQSSQTP